MPTVNRQSGVAITFPDTYRVGPSPMRGDRGRPDRTIAVPLPGDSLADSSESEALIEAMSKRDMQLVDQVQLEPLQGAAVSGDTKRGDDREAMRTQSARVEVELESNETAVILVQQGGLYSWKFSTEEPKTDRVAVPRALGRQKRTVRFDFEISTMQTESHGGGRGILKDLLYERITTYVMKFIARLGVEEATKFLERNVREGLVSIDGLDAANWKPATTSPVKLNSDRSPRILLLLHGTFSSTVGSFGALCGTPWGQQLLTSALADYDAVLGFDHATLQKNPRENASDLLDALKGLGAGPMQIDVVAFSRGGLVFRSLAEYLLPSACTEIRVGRVIFVACTNGGTRLAEPQNWHALVDLYTNLAVGVCRVLGTIPQAKAPTLILKAIIENMGELIKYMASYAVSEEAVPGLAAMEPDGKFVRELNETQPGQPESKQSNYYAITARFHPVIRDGDHEPKELPRRLALALSEGLVTQLMQEENDLVVNTSAMTLIDPKVGGFIKDELAFGKTPLVYHTIYFTRPEVTNAVARWLLLNKPEQAADTTKGRTRGGGKKKVRSGLRPEREMIGAMAGPEVPIAADTDILLTSANSPASDVLAQILEKTPSYVVVSRDYLGNQLHYAFTTEEILGFSAGHSQNELGKVLTLHEYDASMTQLLGGKIPSRAGAGTRGRAVLVSEGRPVGVVPAESDSAMYSNLDLAKLARATTNLTSIMDKVQSRRAFPTFQRFSLKRSAGGRTKSDDAATLLTCYFRAEMEEEILINRATSVEVVVSREILSKIQSPAVATGQSDVHPERKLVIQVIPKAQFALMDKDRAEIDPPAPNAPQTLYFDLKAVHLGTGEVWVIVRQEQTPLVTLVLKPTVVEKHTQLAIGRLLVDARTSEAPRLSEPLHQLLIVEQFNGDKLTYFYELQSPALNLLDKFYSKPFRGDRQVYVKNLYKEIEQRWLSKAGDFEEFTYELKAFGAGLFSELFPDELQTRLWQHLTQLDSVMVVSTEPFIPWELVYIKDPAKSLKEDEGKFMGQMGLVRWLHQAGWPPVELRVRKEKARYVVPDYPHPDYKLPGAMLEKEFLKTTLFAQPIEPQPPDVRRAISEPGTFDLLHFACHGVAEQDNIVNAQLMLEGRVEDGLYIPAYLSASTAEEYADLIRDNRRPIVVLNACQLGLSGYKLTGIGGFSQAFVKKGAGLFIGALWSVGDTPARDFTEGFYKSLLAGDSVAGASIKAREAARLASGATWLAYVVYGHPHAKLQME
jgi:CHAT domain/Ternary complex associated domain 7